MIVQCPRCSTRWRAADAPEVDNPIFKCGRCHNVFRRFPGAPLPHEKAPASGRTRSAREPEVENLEFIFPSRQQTPPSGDDPDSARPAATADEDAMAKVEELALPADLAYEPYGEDTPVSVADQSAPTTSLPEPGRCDAHGDTGRDAPMPRLESVWTLQLEDTMSASAPTQAFGPIRRGLLLLVAAYALLAVLIRANPERGGRWLASLPILGERLAEQPGLIRDIQLRNVEGRFRHIRNARRVFVVSGETVNNSRAAFDRIEIEATLYGPGGELGRQGASTGNRTTLRFSELSESEVGLLQRFDPRVTLGPGEAAPFWIVFMDPPRNLREFSSRVSSVRLTGPASALPQTNRERRPASVG